VNLDDLDDRLLDTFGASFPRPHQIPLCDYDVDRAEMVELCTAARPYENADLYSGDTILISPRLEA